MGGDTLVSSDGWSDIKFDGLGHSISNFVSKKGLKPACNDNANSIFRNVQFINMYMDLNGGANVGLLGEYVSSFENVLIVAKFANAVDGQHVLTGMGQETVHLTNVVVQVEFVDFAGKTIYSFGNGWTQGEADHHATFENVYIVCNETISPIGVDWMPMGTQIEVADITTENVTLSDMWTVEAGKLPYMSAYTTEE